MKLISILSFICGAHFSFFLVQTFKTTNVYTYCSLCTILVYCIVLSLVSAIIRGFLLQVSIRSAFLGFLFGCAAQLSFCENHLRIFGWYMCFMVIFHYSEFLTLAIINPSNVSIDSFMLNHSREYNIAAIGSWIEFALECLLFPSLKDHYYVSILGIIVSFAGEIVRKAAMFTAKTNFSHIVEETKRNDHKLVTHGIYSYCRHPSYVGWFFFAIGTQLILINPVCVVLYAVVSWRFFRQRIIIEEVILLQFFGIEYYNYQRKVGTGLPFIHGSISDTQKGK